VCPELTVLNIYSLSFRIFGQLALVLKNGVALKFFTVLKCFLSFRIFEQLVLALKFFKPGGKQPPRGTPMLLSTKGKMASPRFHPDIAWRSFDKRLANTFFQSAR